MSSRPRALRVPLLVAILSSACVALTADAAHAQGTFRPLRFGDPQELAYDAELFPGAHYDASVPAPDALLGQPVGSRIARHDEILAYFRALDAVSGRVTLETFGRTHEGRPLVLAVITSPANHERLDDILADVGRLADPRGLSKADGERLAQETPAVAWLGYSIHGDETSGSDASLVVAHHLAACTDEDVTRLLDRLVIVIDPCLNPDGRQRILTQIEQSAGYATNLDPAGMQRGRWPYGRGNHYLFDMNRDWMWGVQPETRARWAAVQRFNPQLFVDAHEMGALDTFLFYPARAPVNPDYPQAPRAWWKRFAEDQAAAFDRYGWSYYTREWAESWYVGYSDSWAAFRGAIGLLYEQARYAGQPLRRESGEVVTYREAVHRQAASSLANLTTLENEREAVLASFRDEKREHADPEHHPRSFVMAPGRHPDREARFVERLVAQGIELVRVEREVRGEDVVDAQGETRDERTFPAGSIVIPAAQPLGPLLRTYLDPDPRMDAESLRLEREELERRGESRVYDVTAWSMAQAFDLDGAWCRLGDVDGTRIERLPAEPAGLVPTPDGAAAYGWIVDGRRDASVGFAARALELGLAVHLAKEDFQSAGRAFTRGSLLVRRHENGDDVVQLVERAADAAGVEAVATASGLSPDEGPDLGGGRFVLLERPRVAVISNHPVANDAYGHVWHELDVGLGLPFTPIDAAWLGDHDLRAYNVLVLPPAWGDGAQALVAQHAEKLGVWVQAGGTLIAIGSSAGAWTDPELELSSVRMRRDALEELPQHDLAVRRERLARFVELDADALYDGKDLAREETLQGSDEEVDADALTDRDAWQRRFAPHGSILRAEVDTESWVTVGALAEVAVMFEDDRAFLGMPPATTPVRMAEGDRLRISGLLWPEARERVADSAWLTLESRGDGQTILFATSPVFRGWFPSTARLFANAVVYGPGAGANPVRAR